MHLNIGQRIISGFGLIITLMIGLGVYQLSNVSQMRDQGAQVVDGEFQALQLLREVGNSQRAMRVLKEEASVAVLLSAAGQKAADPLVLQSEWEIAKERAITKIEEVATFAKSRLEQSDSENRRDLWQQVLNNNQETKKLLKDIITGTYAQFDHENKGNLASLPSSIEFIQKLRAEFSVTARTTEDLLIKLASNAKKEINQTHQDITRSAILATLLIVIAGIATALFIHRSIVGPLKQFMGFVEKVGNGDLTQKIEINSRDELGQLAHYLNNMVEGLSDATQQARSATEQLNAATAELKAASQQQSASTSEQNAAIQQITSTLDEIKQSGSQISDRAKSVATTAEATSSASKSGLVSAAETATAMAGIRAQTEAVASNIVALTEKTHSVGEIISSVNDIAERSDLLALNAAIEASSAGEHGQSFAVVADEMKNLASQAKKATAQVRSILSDIQQGINSAVMQTEEAVKRSDVGERQAKDMESAISSLAGSIETSVATFEQIVAAINQQQIGVEQVADSIRNIREASEQMIAGTRDLDQSAGGLAKLGGDLQRSMERYSV